MGQYWYPVNLDKREFVHPHKLGSGLKLWEQLASQGTGQALVILTAAMPEPRGGGDLSHEDDQDRGAAYIEVAKRTIGRWAGDRIALVGDYAEDDDLKRKRGDPKASAIYALCSEPDDEGYDARLAFRDITDDVCAVIEHELDGKFMGDGWREFVSPRPKALESVLGGDKEAA